MTTYFPAARKIINLRLLLAGFLLLPLIVVNPSQVAQAAPLAATYTINASVKFVSIPNETDGYHGTIEPFGVVPVDSGTSKIFTITPDNAFTVNDVTVNGVIKNANLVKHRTSAPEGNIYYTIEITEGIDFVGDTTITVSFKVPPEDTFPGVTIAPTDLPFDEYLFTKGWRSSTLYYQDPDKIVGGEDCNSNIGGATVWYNFKPDSTEYVHLSTYNDTYESYDTLIAVWTGTNDGPETLVACNNNNPNPDVPIIYRKLSELTFKAEVNQTYYIEIVHWFSSYTAQDTVYGKNLHFRMSRANTEVRIGGDLMAGYEIGSGDGVVFKEYIDGGPVVITNNTGGNVIASLNQWRARREAPYVWTGVAQFTALRTDKVSNIYVIPRYDYTDPSKLYNAIVVSNLDAVDHEFTVTIEGRSMNDEFNNGKPFTVLASGDTVLRFSGVAGGPVVVSSASGSKIIASLYELRRDPNWLGWNGQSEMMGIPWGELSDSYVIPRYYGAVSPDILDMRLFIANPESVERSVTVKIGGVEMVDSPYTLQPNTGKVLKYNIDGGPVEIIGPSGSKIVASLSQWRARREAPYVWTGVTQFMALRTDKVSNIYVIPRYDYTDPSKLYNAIVVSNLDAVDHEFTVTIEGRSMNDEFNNGKPFTVLASGDTVLRFSGVAGGPVVVSSASGSKIIASLYELRRDPNWLGWNGQSEMMGIPWGELSDSYVIPRYYGAVSPDILDMRLFIAVP